jgi:hypothetical protein
LLCDSNAGGSIKSLPAKQSPRVTGILANARKMGNLGEMGLEFSGLTPENHRPRGIFQEGLRQSYDPPGAAVHA